MKDAGKVTTSPTGFVKGPDGKWIKPGSGAAPAAAAPGMTHVITLLHHHYSLVNSKQLLQRLHPQHHLLLHQQRVKPLHPPLIALPMHLRLLLVRNSLVLVRKSMYLYFFSLFLICFYYLFIIWCCLSSLLYER